MWDSSRIYKLGTLFIEEHSREVYILCNVGTVGGNTHYAMIGLRHGNRWMNPVELDVPRTELTGDDMEMVASSDNFRIIDDILDVTSTNIVVDRAIGDCVLERDKKKQGGKQ